jgi:hypothetical protein
MLAAGGETRVNAHGVDGATTMRLPEESSAVLIEHPHPHTEDRRVYEAPYRETASPIAPRVVRCACEACGAHTNAVWTFRVGGSCPTCGSFRLAPIEGAELMDLMVA